MKFKITTLAISALFIYSCATKSSVAVVAVKNEELKPEVILETKSSVMTEELYIGKTLFENKCGNCHSIYNPKDFSSEQWKPILLRMKKEANLDDIEITSISNYINSQL